MKRTPLLLRTMTAVLIPLFGLTQAALAHKNNVNLVVSFNPNPAPAGPPAAIIATLTFDGTQGSGPNGHAAPSAGTPVAGEKVQIQEWMVNGLGAACGTPGGGWQRIDGSGAGLITNSSGQGSMSFNTVGLAGQTIGFRAHHPAEGGSHGTEQKQSECANLEIVNGLVGMPVTKTINGTPATCQDGPDLRAPQNGGTGNPDHSRKCSFLGITPILDLFDDDPRFDVNAYETVNGLPGQALNPVTKQFDFGPFPQPGPRIPPLFHPSLPPGTELTICERLTYPAPYTNIYTLSTVTTTSDLTGIPESQPIYFRNGSDGNRYACFNIVMPDDGTTEFAINLDNTEVCTYSQGGYGGNDRNSPGYLKLSTSFGALYPFGLLVGDQSTIGVPQDGAPNGYSVLWTSAAAVNSSIPSTGPNKDTDALDQDYMNPPNGGPAKHPGEFTSQVTTLQLNVDLGGIGNYMLFTGAGQCGDTLTVSDVLADANTALSGQESTCTIGQLNALGDALTRSFHECVANPDFTLFDAPVPEQ